MANGKYLELAKKIDSRFLELMGKPYEKIGRGHHGHEGAISKLVKEFDMTSTTVHEYLRLSRQPSPILRMIKQGGIWSHWLEAIHAPEPLQSVLFTKIQNNEFSSRLAIRDFIKKHKDLATEGSPATLPDSPELSDELPKTDPPIVNWSQYVREQFEKHGAYSPKDAAMERYGNTEDHNVKNMMAIVYNMRREFAKKLGKQLVREGENFILTDMDKTTTQSPVAPTIAKTRTAVLVAREVRTEEGTRYELDIVGDFNRGMMKEALKQLMEVFV